MTDILIVEDNQELAELLGDFLRREQYIVSIARDGEKALELYEKYGARLLVLDIMLPGPDGFAILKKIREQDNTPILIVSARTEKDDKLNGLLLGADDYIEKPYDIDILLAKIKGIFRRRYQADSIVSGELRLDKINKQVYRQDKALNMTAKEFELLLLLVENAGQTLKKEMLFARIWGFDSFSEPQTLTVHINRLREKIEEDPKHPRHLLTVWGVGYRYEV